MQESRSAQLSTELLSTTIRDSPYVFLQPSPQLHAASLELAKHYLDPLATSVSETQATRLQASRKKRKRGEPEDTSLRDVLRLKQLHLEGFGVDHVWDQAKRIIDASHREVQRCMHDTKPTQNGRKAADTPRNGVSEQKLGSAEIDIDLELDGAESEASDDEDDPVEDDEVPDADDLDEVADDLDASSSAEFYDAAETTDEFVPDKHGLNDGFFSIDDFNRQTDFLERQDARGDPDDGAASDEEDVDWDLDPTSLPLPQDAARAANHDDDLSREDSPEADEDGPTFGNADLDAPFDTSDDEEVVEDDLALDDPTSNTNEVFYGDFFAPPAQQKSKTKKGKQVHFQSQPEAVKDDGATDANIQRAVASVRRDIFEEDEVSEASGSDDQVEQNLSSHQRRQAALATQIRALEAEAIAKREWTMSGEARAIDRPLNSLLEEDLDFERAGKPVPVITAEVSSSIEELIKQRILARQFDEVIKRLPGSEALAPSTVRRGLVDIETRNHDQGLADIYEAEHQRLTDPNFVDKRDAKLKAAHAEIERLWKDVSSKLDALSNWQYRPKPADVEVKVVTDAPRVAMEDARPGGVGLATEQSGLAPQEVYRAGAEKGKGEVFTKAGAVMGTAELSREEKRSRRRREKDRAKKRAGNATLKPQGAAASAPTRAQEQKGVVDELKRGGVKVIGKEGQLVDVEGKKIKAAHRAKGAGSLKL